MHGALHSHNDSSFKGLQKQIGALFFPDKIFPIERSSVSQSAYAHQRTFQELSNLQNGYNRGFSAIIHANACTNRIPIHSRSELGQRQISSTQPYHNEPASTHIPSKSRQQRSLQQPSRSPHLPPLQRRHQNPPATSRRHRPHSLILLPARPPRTPGPINPTCNP